MGCTRLLQQCWKEEARGGFFWGGCEEPSAEKQQLYGRDTLPMPVSAAPQWQGPGKGLAAARASSSPRAPPAREGRSALGKSPLLSGNWRKTWIKPPVSRGAGDPRFAPGAAVPETRSLRQGPGLRSGSPGRDVAMLGVTVPMGCRHLGEEVAAAA